MSTVHEYFFSPLLKITERHAIEFEPKWQRLVMHETAIIVVDSLGFFKTLNCASDFFLSVSLSKLLIGI